MSRVKWVIHHSVKLIGLSSVCTMVTHFFISIVNAASKGYISIVEYLLLESHANPLIKNNFGEAAYDVSAAAGESYICDMLHKAGKVWWQMQHTSSEGKINNELLINSPKTLL